MSIIADDDAGADVGAAAAGTGVKIKIYRLYIFNVQQSLSTNANIIYIYRQINYLLYSKIYNIPTISIHNYVYYGVYVNS